MTRLSLHLFVVSLLVLNQIYSALSGQSLKSYKIKKDSLTVSGISSGAAFAVQFHVAHSTLVSGAGSVAGPPYYCSAGTSIAATTTCMSGLIGYISMPYIEKIVKQYAADGLIDDPANLKRSHVYVFSGLLDFVVATTVVMKTQQFYEAYINPSHVKSVYSVSSAHGFITNNYGYSCSVVSTNYLNNCNYNQAFHIIRQVYPEEDIIEPASDFKATGTLSEINQKEFFPASSSSLSLDDTGYIYVPTYCEKNECKLHVAFHGCLQGKQVIGTDFIVYSGFNQVADLNNIIILYPQVKITLGSNMNGCWDWWGYTDKYFATKKGPQISTIKRMIDRIMNTSAQ